MTKVPIDLILLIRPASSYRFEDAVERLTTESIPRFFAALQPGASLWQSELVLAALCTPGVRRARLVRLSRVSTSGGIPPERLEFEPDEIATLGHVEIGPETEPSRSPFA
jgi:hypothetical protein